MSDMRAIHAGIALTTILENVTREHIALLKRGPDAAALGRRGGLKGGPATAAKRTPEERQRLARKAAHARWGTLPKPQIESLGPSVRRITYEWGYFSSTGNTTAGQYGVGGAKTRRFRYIHRPIKLGFCASCGTSLPPHQPRWTETVLLLCLDCGGPA